MLCEEFAMETEDQVGSEEAVDVLALEQVLRDWAGAQSPGESFSGWKMAAFTMPAQMRRGPFFAPGELVLCRPALEMGELAERMELTPPLQVWSFDLKKAVFVSRGLLALQTGGFEVPIVPAAALSEAPDANPAPAAH
jgi:hypothetical protein